MIHVTLHYFPRTHLQLAKSLSHTVPLVTITWCCCLTTTHLSRLAPSFFALTPTASHISYTVAILEATLTQLPRSTCYYTYCIYLTLYSHCLLELLPSSAVTPSYVVIMNTATQGHFVCMVSYRKTHLFQLAPSGGESSLFDLIIPNFSLLLRANWPPCLPPVFTLTHPA